LQLIHTIAPYKKIGIPPDHPIPHFTISGGISMNINKENVKIDPSTMKSEIDAKENAIYLVSNGQAVKYPMPEFGTIEVSFQRYKPGRPAYKIVAD
jgi:hypothetical protein